RRGALPEGASADEMREMLEKMNAGFRDGAPLSAAGAATIILDGVRSGAWRILVGQDAINLDAAVRARPEDAYDYPALACRAAERAARGRRGPARAGGGPARAGAKGRLPARLLARAGQARAVGDIRPLVALPRRHVPADGGGWGGGGAAAQPVPAPRAALPVPRAELPRAAAPAGRAGRPVPERAVRGARRADQGAGDAAERRAHLLHPGPGRGRGPRRAGDDPAGLRRARHRAGPVPAVAAGPGQPRQPGQQIRG